MNSVDKLIKLILDNKNRFSLVEMPIKALNLAFIWWDKYPFNYHKNKRSSKSLFKIHKVDTSKPIILLKSDDRLFVLDGMHRLKKLRDIEKKDYVKAYLVPVEEVFSLLTFIDKKE